MLGNISDLFMGNETCVRRRGLFKLNNPRLHYSSPPPRILYTIHMVIVSVIPTGTNSDDTIRTVVDRLKNVVFQFLFPRLLVQEKSQKSLLVMLFLVLAMGKPLLLLYRSTIWLITYPL